MDHVMNNARLNLALGIGHLADEDVARGVDAVFGINVEHVLFLC